MGAEAPSIRQEGKCSLVLVGDPGENEDSVLHTEMADDKFCGFAEICSHRGRLGAFKPPMQGLLNIWHLNLTYLFRQLKRNQKSWNYVPFPNYSSLPRSVKLTGLRDRMKRAAEASGLALCSMGMRKQGLCRRSEDLCHRTVANDQCSTITSKSTKRFLHWACETALFTWNLMGIGNKDRVINVSVGTDTAWDNRSFHFTSEFKAVVAQNNLAWKRP